MTPRSFFLTQFFALNFKGRSLQDDERVILVVAALAMLRSSCPQMIAWDRYVSTVVATKFERAGAPFRGIKFIALFPFEDSSEPDREIEFVLADTLIEQPHDVMIVRSEAALDELRPRYVFT